MFKAIKSNKNALIGFVLTCLFGGFARMVNGVVYSQNELLNLFEALQRSGLYLGSAIATSSGTTLALMLTVIGLVKRVDHDFEMPVYRTIALIGWTSAICLVACVLLLLTIALPIGEFDGVPTLWYQVLYNVTFAGMVFVCALAVSIVLMLLNTVLTVVRKITPTDDA